MKILFYVFKECFHGIICFLCFHSTYSLHDPIISSIYCINSYKQPQLIQCWLEKRALLTKIHIHRFMVDKLIFDTDCKAFYIFRKLFIDFFDYCHNSGVWDFFSKWKWYITFLFGSNAFWFSQNKLDNNGFKLHFDFYYGKQLYWI